MTKPLSEPKPARIPGIAATHYAHSFRCAPTERRVDSTIVYGTMDGAGRFYPLTGVGIESHAATIAGEYYDTLASSGSAQGRFWPEDVLARHIAMADPAVVV